MKSNWRDRQTVTSQPWRLCSHNMWAHNSFSYIQREHFQSLPPSIPVGLGHFNCYALVSLPGVHTARFFWKSLPCPLHYDFQKMACHRTHTPCTVAADVTSSSLAGCVCREHICCHPHPFPNTSTAGSKHLPSMKSQPRVEPQTLHLKGAEWGSSLTPPSSARSVTAPLSAIICSTIRIQLHDFYYPRGMKFSSFQMKLSNKFPMKPGQRS